MSIVYPLALPTVTGIKTYGWNPKAVVAVSESPFTLEQQVQIWPGEAWAVSVTLPPMRRPKADIWNAWRLALRGRAGTFLLGDYDGRIPRGTIGASGIVLNGAHSVRAREISLKGLVAGATVLAGDYLQLGSGLTARLHKALFGGTADAEGHLTVDVWPGLRADYADNNVVVTRSTAGLFRMTSNTMPWTSDEAATYGLSFDAQEAL